jgi:hypothetical protein
LLYGADEEWLGAEAACAVGDSILGAVEGADQLPSFDKHELPGMNAFPLGLMLLEVIAFLDQGFGHKGWDVHHAEETALCEAIFALGDIAIGDVIIRYWLMGTRLRRVLSVIGCRLNEGGGRKGCGNPGGPPITH